MEEVDRRMEEERERRSRRKRRLVWQMGCSQAADACLEAFFLLNRLVCWFQCLLVACLILNRIICCQPDNGSGQPGLFHLLHDQSLDLLLLLLSGLRCCPQVMCLCSLVRLEGPKEPSVNRLCDTSLLHSLLNT